jgi:type II secretory pathway pseudopilin PulG
MSRLRSFKRRAAGEGGYTITELLTVLAILGTVLAGLTGVFVSALRAEVDANERFQAQQEVRLALSKIRREIQCARSATISDGGAMVTFTSAITTPPSAGASQYCQPGDTSWCAREVAVGRYALYREAGTACTATSGTRIADHLTTSAVFELEHPPLRQATLRVDFNVDANTANTRADYRLRDAVALRASVRGSSANGVCDPPRSAGDWNPNCPTTYTPLGAARAPGFYNFTNPYDTGFHGQINAEVARENGYDPGKVDWWDYDFSRPRAIE